MIGRLLASPEARGRLLVSIGALAVYPELLTFRKLFHPDDVFTSDVFNGELPARVLIGQMLARGELPLWTRQVGGGYPLGAGLLGDPIGAVAFTLLPPAAALSACLIFLLLCAAHGVYSLSRHLGSSIGAAVFAGTAFAGSGYFVCQLRHLSILATVAWLPWGLLLVDRALSSKAATTRLGLITRARALGLLGLVVAIQASAGFPQSLYISCLVYGLYGTLVLVPWAVRAKAWSSMALLAALAALAVVLGGLAGSLSLMPLKELADSGGRNAEMAWQLAQQHRYRWVDALNLFSPYINGDASNRTYQGRSPFWEVYGYSGLLTAILGLVALLLARRHPRVVVLALVMGLSMLAVLGPTTPAFQFLWTYLPGFSMFRFPTRFLVVVLLMLVLLASIALTEIERHLRQRWPKQVRTRRARLLLGAALLFLVVDLFHHQRRQNPFVDAKRWLEPPATARYIKERPHGLVHSPAHMTFHGRAFGQANGWQNLEPFYRLRGALAPNLAPLWGLASIDLYSGASPTPWRTVWGDHNAPPLAATGIAVTPREMTLTPGYLSLARAFGVTHLLVPHPVVSAELKPPKTFADGTSVYEIGGKRAYWAAAAVTVPTDFHAASVLANVDLLREEVVVFGPDVPKVLHAVPLRRAGSPIISDLSSQHVRADVRCCGGGYLVLADTYYPGWTATIDGQPTELLRANVAGRAVRLPPSAQFVDFVYLPTVYEAAAFASGASLLMLLLWLYLCRIAGARLLEPAPKALAGSRPKP